MRAKNNGLLGMLVAAALGLANWVQAQIGPTDFPYLDPAFAPRIAGVVYAVADQADGKLIIAGTFTNINDVPVTNLARLNVDGSLDAGFRAPALRLNGGSTNLLVGLLAVQADGQILIGGAFNEVDGLARTNLARLHVDGSLDPAFTPAQLPPRFASPPQFSQASALKPAGAMFSTIQPQADGKILIGWSVQPGPDLDLIYHLKESLRLRVDGSIDSSYTNALPALPVATQSNGRVLIFGNGKPKPIERYQADGSLDPSYDTSFLNRYTAPIPNFGLTYYPGGLASFCTDQLVGVRLTGGYSYYVDVFWLLPDGKTNQAVPVINLEAAPAVVASLRDGSVVLAGLAGSFSYSPKGSAKVTRPAPPIMLFRPRPLPVALGASMNSPLVLTAKLTNGPYQWQFRGTNLPGETNATLRIARVRLADAGLYSLANPAPTGVCVDTSLPQAILTVTDPSPVRGPDAAGTVDLTFDPGSGADREVAALALQADGRIIAGGSFQNFNGARRGGVARLGANGLLDPAFATGPGASGGTAPAVTVVGLKPDGRVVIGGGFATVDGVARQGLAILSVAGKLDSAFDPAVYQTTWPEWFPCYDISRTNQAPSELLVTRAGRIYAAQPDEEGGKSFFFYDEETKHRSMLNILVNIFGGFGTRYEVGAVEALVESPDEKVILAGRFHTTACVSSQLKDILCFDQPFTGKKRYAAGEFPFTPLDAAVQADGRLLVVGSGGMARLDLEGRFDASFATGYARSNFTHIALAPDGKILVAGDFQTMDGYSRSRLARFHADGTLDLAFDAGSGPNGLVRALKIQPDGKILIGGAFTEVDGVARRGVARLRGGALRPWFGELLHTGGTFQFSFPTKTNTSFMVDFASSLSATNWTALTNFPGDGSVRRVVDPAPGVPRRFYRVRPAP